MTDRQKKIFAQLPECNVFADVGCDHGYLAKAMLLSGKCASVIISDVSEKCLEKAKELLKDGIVEGKVKAVVSNGFEKVMECDLALIAGMGGEEIISIIKNAPFLPERLVLQPMKNSDKVRRCVLENGYAVQRDFTFFSGGEFYDLMVLQKGKDELTKEEIEFGRTNLIERPQAFIDKIRIELKKYQTYLEKQGLSQSAREQLKEKTERLKKYV